MVECAECGREYTNIGNHWYHSPSHRPKLTEKQLEITTGLLMGDGCVENIEGNCRLTIHMISRNYLKHLDNIFDCLGTGVSLYKSASESAKGARESGFRPNANKENYSHLYEWRTRAHPKFNEFREWYSSGEKVWPEDIELTPTVLKHWYVGDGNYNNKKNHNNIRISMSNEIENTNKVSEYFSNIGLPKPSNYSISKRNSVTKNCNAVWTVEDSQKLFDYMGEPLPDFEYKWPEEYR